LANGVVILFYLNSLSRITKRKEWGIGYLSDACHRDLFALGSHRPGAWLTWGFSGSTSS
jgi:hypothetical protein